MHEDVGGILKPSTMLYTWQPGQPDIRAEKDTVVNTRMLLSPLPEQMDTESWHSPLKRKPTPSVHAWESYILCQCYVLTTIVRCSASMGQAWVSACLALDSQRTKVSKQNGLMKKQQLYMHSVEWYTAGLWSVKFLTFTEIETQSIYGMRYVQLSIYKCIHI